MAFGRFIGFRARCGALVIGLVAVTAVVLAGAAVAEPGPCHDSAYLTWRPSDGHGHRLSIVDREAGELVDVAELPYRVNAMGYHSTQQRMYGLARSDLFARHIIRPHLVSIDTSGRTTDLGHLWGDERPISGLIGSYAGAIHDGNLVVLSLYELVTIDVTDEVGRIISRTMLSHPADLLNIGDFDTDGRFLYGVDSKARAVVRIDPQTGGVERIPVADLPTRTLAGAVFITDDRRLHVILNGIDGEAVAYRMDMTAEHPTAVEYARWPMVTAVDAAACPPSLIPAPTPTLRPTTPAPTTPVPSTPIPSDQPPPTTSPTPTPTTDPIVTPPPSPSPTLFPPPSESPPPPSPSPTPPPSPVEPPESPDPVDPPRPTDPPPTTGAPGWPGQPGQPDPPQSPGPTDRPPGAPGSSGQPEPSATNSAPASSSASTSASASDSEAPDDRGRAHAAGAPSQPEFSTVGSDDSQQERRRWLAVTVVILAMVGAAGVKASAKRSKR